MKPFKTLFIFLFLVIASASYGQANAIDKYFKQYVDDERFSVVYIGPKLFEILGQFKVDGIDVDDDEAEAFLDVAKDTKGLRILTSKESSRSFYEEAKQKINTSEYEVLMTVRNNQEKKETEFFVREENNVIKELFLLSGGPNDFTMMSFIGNLNLRKISNLAKTMEENKN